MLADSMTTFTLPGPESDVTTNFANAEKLVALGRDLPAGAMVNGLGNFGSEIMAAVLKRAGDALDRGEFPSTADGVESAVTETVNSVYAPALEQQKADLARHWSQPGLIEKVNASRAARGLPPLDTVTPERVQVRNDPLSPTQVLDWDVVGDFTVTVIVASFFGSQRAVEIEWPGPRVTVVVPEPLRLAVNWWGSGQAGVSRIIRGFDMGIVDRLADQGDHEIQEVQRIANTRSEFQMPTPVSAMPLQDAIEFTEFLGQVSCGYDKFTLGPPSVGGPLDVLVLRPGSRHWICQKSIHSSLPKR